MTNVLIIEDEEQIRTSVCDWLTFEGFSVYSAEDGRVGLELAKMHKPDLILSDISMPNMDGHELLLEIRSDLELSGASFIFLTAAAERDSIRQGMDMGADDYLTKPFTHAELIRAVKSRLFKKEARSEKFLSQIDRLNQAISTAKEKESLKSRLVAMFSHDFRNPLTAIMSSANILEHFEDKLDPVRKKGHFDRINGSVHLLIQMLDEMMLSVEMEGQNLACRAEETDVRHLMRAIISEFNLIYSQRQEITFSQDGSQLAWIDGRLFRQIVVNLLSNAIKYSNKGTSIEIQLCITDSTLKLTIQDQGIGIPDEDLGSLFSPFYRAQNVQAIKGSGLGLAIVKQAVEICEGDIEVKSKVGQGTQFTVSIPNRQELAALESACPT